MTDAPDQSKDSTPERGVNRVARDFDRALAILAATGGIRAFVLEQAREESWTRAVVNAPKGSKANNVKPEPFRLDAGRMAAVIGTGRSSVYDAVKWLTAARVFIADGGAMTINTQYATWIKPTDGTPLLTPEQVEWCREAADFRMFRGLSVTTDKRSFVRSSVHDCPVQRTTAPVTPDKLSVTPDNRTIEERTRNSALSSEAEKHTEVVGGSDSVSDSLPESIGIDDPRHPANADGLNPAKPFLHDGPTMPENFAELSRKAIELFRGQRTSFPGLLAGMRSDAVWIDLYREIPADVWHDALRSLASVKDATKWTPGYYLAIVKRQWREIQEGRRAAASNAAPKRKETPIPPARTGGVDPEYLAIREKTRLNRIAFLEKQEAEKRNRVPMGATG